MVRPNNCPQCGELNGARATGCVVCGTILPITGLGSPVGEESTDERLITSHDAEENAYEQDNLEVAETQERTSWRGAIIFICVNLSLLGALAAYLFSTQPKKITSVGPGHHNSRLPTGERPGFVPENSPATNSSELVSPLVVTSLYDAALFGEEDIVRKRLDEGANVNAFDAKMGWTPLMAAAARGKDKVVRLLLERGADAKIVDKGGETALYKAGVFGYGECIRLLADAGCDVNAFTNKGLNPLLIASSVKHEEAVAILLEKGANPNVKAKAGAEASPLILAAGYGSVEIVKALLDKGADVNASDKNGFTALQAATRMNHDNIAQLLRQAGATK